MFPITAFVAAGFEHSIANMYFLPLAMLLGAPVGAADMARNLVPVIAGNIVGGSVLVALVYCVIYVRGRPPGAGSRVNFSMIQQGNPIDHGGKVDLTPSGESSAGLSSEEARRRLAAEGRNTLPGAGQRSALAIALEVLRERCSCCSSPAP